MFRAVIAVALLAVAAPAFPSQEPSQGQQQQQPSQDDKSAQGKQKPDKPYTKPLQQSPPQKSGTLVVDVQGCVTRGSAPGSFVLSAVTTNPLSARVGEKLTGTIASPTYQLYGHTSELQGLVGHRVEVKGTTQKKPEKTLEVGHDSPAVQAGPKTEGTSGHKEKTPKVKTSTEAKVELRRLDVQALRAVEGACR